MTNPDFTQFKDAGGNDLPFHAGFTKLEDGTTTTKYVTMGVCETKAGKVYAMVLHPYTALEIAPPAHIRGTELVYAAPAVAVAQRHAAD